MEAKYELIKYQDETRIHFHHMNLIKAGAHWHTELEFLFVFSGSLTLIIDGTTYVVHAQEFAVINSGQIHSCQSDSQEDCEIALLQISDQFFTNLDINIDHTNYQTLYSSDSLSPYYSFDCTKILEIAHEIYDILSKKEEDYKAKLNLACCDIMFHLKSYSTVSKNNTANEQINVTRIKNMLNYIEAHYAEDISCNALADYAHVSVYYLSHCFKKYTNTTITKYLNYYRISKIQYDLKNTADSITDIYLRHGFNNSKTFNRTFKEIADCSPSEWRKREVSPQDSLNIQPSEKEIVDTGIGTYVKFIQPVDISSRKYILAKKAVSETTQVSAQSSAPIAVRASYNTFTTSFRKSYQFLTGTGRAHDFLKAGFQKQFREIFSHFSFEYIRFFGIFNRELDVVHIINGTVNYNFFYVDEILDFLLENRCRPYLVLGFMPEDFRSHDETLYFYRASTAPPKTLTLWRDLISTFMEHLIERYTLAEVQHWIFEVWNEPDIDFWSGTYEEYLALYKVTVQTIRSFHPDILIGGAAFSNLAFEHYGNVDKFLAYCKKEKCLPDYLGMHPYPVKLEPLPDQLTVLQKMLGRDYLSYSIQSLKEHLKETGWNNIPLHFNEWNSTPGIDDYVHDTAFMASFLIENIVKNLNKIDILAYWCLSDLIDEKGVPAKEFCGSFGFLTRSGLKKPTFYAFETLTRLSPQILTQGEDYLVTGDKQHLQVLLWNYCHYNETFCNGDKSLLTYYDRYQIFEPVPIKEYDIVLTDLDASLCQITTTCFDRNHGSAYDFWLKNGAPEYFSKEQLRFFQSQIHPLQKQEYRNLDDRKLTLQASVEPFGFTLFEITLLTDRFNK